MSHNKTKVNSNGASLEVRDASETFKEGTQELDQRLHFHTSDEEVRWYAPAMRRQVDAEARELLVELRSLANDQQPAVWHLTWDFVLRARAACQELENMEEEARQLLKRRAH